MKRVLLPAALLLCAATACAPAPTTNIANTNANAANANAAPTTAAVTEADATARVNEVWDTIKRKDYAAFGNHLAEDFVDVTDAGVQSKAQTVERIRRSDLTEINHSDFKVVRLGGDAFAVVHTTRARGTFDGKPLPADAAFRHTGAWVNRGGRWVVAYHQISEVKPPPPTPAATATPAGATSPAASPAASPGTIVTTADAEANERAVWDALKRKDWDAFASAIADDAVEVFTYGVHTSKADIVEGVREADQMFNFSSMTLSDLKSVTLNDSTKLVTYTIKGTGPDKKPFTEYAATIWVNRGGRWLAVFHQGTEAAPAGT